MCPPRIVVLALPLCLALLTAQANANLNVGDLAPELKVAHWVKGDKIEKLNRGKVYVVEFWATWCGPCRISIPHLTELAHQFKPKGVTFIGVDVWETDTKEVKPFVDKMGAKMDYNVGLDSVPSGADPHHGGMARTWLAAADEHSIPTAFVIQDGKVAWIGHPMNLDKPLAAIVAGEWDVAAFAKRRQAQIVVQQKTDTINTRIMPLFKAKKYQEFVKALDKITSGNDVLATQFAGLKLAALCNGGDTDEALTLGAKLLDEHTHDANALNTIFWTVIDPQVNHKPDPRVVALALTAAKRAVTLSGEKNARNLDTLAMAQFLSGHPVAALASEEKAVKVLEGRPNGGSDPNLKLFIERAERYRKAAQAKQKGAGGS